MGPLAIESYVVFRTRPLLERLERRTRKIAFRLQLLEVVVFAIQASGSLLAAFDLGVAVGASCAANARIPQHRVPCSAGAAVRVLQVWVAITVALAGIIMGMLAFVDLRGQLISTNLAVRALQNKITWWDAQTLVLRRATGTKLAMVDATEKAYLKMVDGQTSAAADMQEDGQEDADSSAAGKEGDGGDKKEKEKKG